MKKFNEFIQKLNEEVAPRLPKDINYWLKKGKIGKKCVIITHDDMDGVFSGIIMKNYLLNNGFDIVSYGVINYQMGWKEFDLDPKYINICLDYAEANTILDFYLDHHSVFSDVEKTKYISANKTKTTSAYEGVCLTLGIPVDSIVVDVIDMIDAARYKEHGVDVENVLDFDMSKFKNKLEFAAAFNQTLKRTDYRTIIEVIHNSKGSHPSIYDIFRLFKKIYPLNNTFRNGSPKQYLGDAKWRLGQVKTRTRGIGKKTYVNSQSHFKSLFSDGGNVIVNGYQIIGQLIFVPTGTWANPIRARAIVEQDLKSVNIPTVNYEIVGDMKKEYLDKDGEVRELVGDIIREGSKQKLDIKEDATNNIEIEGIKGRIVVVDGDVHFLAKQPLFWVMLQYGNSLQVCSFREMKKYVKKYLPKTKDGQIINNLDTYTKGLLENFKTHLDYNNNLTSAGGHIGIGSLTNIIGECKKEGNFKGVKFIDLFKNKIISDLSGVNWNDLGMRWKSMEDEERSGEKKEIEVNKKLLSTNELKTLK